MMIYQISCSLNNIKAKYCPWSRVLGEAKPRSRKLRLSVRQNDLQGSRTRPASTLRPDVRWSMHLFGRVTLCRVGFFPDAHESVLAFFGVKCPGWYSLGVRSVAVFLRRLVVGLLANADETMSSGGSPETVRCSVPAIFATRNVAVCTRRSYNIVTVPHRYRERKCADTVGTVLVAGHFQC